MPGIKLLNPYTLPLGARLYEETPKAVFAAIAVSFGTLGGDQLEHAAVAIAREWRALYNAGIIPQPPSKTAKAFDDGRPHGEPFGAENNS